MTNKLITNFFLSLLLAMLSSSCNSAIENALAGKYYAITYESCNECAPPELPTLTLNTNKKFSVQYIDSTIHGTWKVNEYDDFVQLELNNEGLTSFADVRFENNSSNVSLDFSDRPFFFRSKIKSVIYIKK